MEDVSAMLFGYLGPMGTRRKRRIERLGVSRHNTEWKQKEAQHQDQTYLRQTQVKQHIIPRLVLDQKAVVWVCLSCTHPIVVAIFENPSI